MKKLLYSILGVPSLIAFTAALSHAVAVVPQPVPEPATWMLLGAGMAGVVAFKAIRNRKK